MTEYRKLSHKSIDLRRLKPERRPQVQVQAERHLTRRYGVSPAYARLIAELQGYDCGDVV